MCIPPSSVVVNTQGQESRGSGFETCSGVWCTCGVAINNLVDLNWLGNPQVWFVLITSILGSLPLVPVGDIEAIRSCMAARK